MTFVHTLIIALVILAIAAVVVVVVRNRNQKVAAEVEEIMATDYVKTKNQAIKISDRIDGQITNHAFHWLRFKDERGVRSYLRYSDLLAAEELEPAERRKLDAIDEHLREVVKYRAEKVSTPTGVVIHKDLMFDEITQYLPGIKRVTDRNHVAIKIGAIEDNKVAITDIYFSVNLGTELTTHFNLIDSDSYMAYQEYRTNPKISGALAMELEHLDNVIKANIDKYNTHAKHLQFKGADVPTEYKYERRDAGKAVTSQLTQEEVENAPVV